MGSMELLMQIAEVTRKVAQLQGEFRDLQSQMLSRTNQLQGNLTSFGFDIDRNTKAFDNSFGAGGTVILHHGSGELEIRGGGGDGLPWSLLSFGWYHSTSTKIGVLPGKVFWGERQPAESSEKVFTLATGLNWVYVAYDLTDPTACEVFVNESTPAVSESNTVKQNLYCFNRDSSTDAVSLTNISHLGDVFLPAITA